MTGIQASITGTVDGPYIGRRWLVCNLYTPHVCECSHIRNLVVSRSPSWRCLTSHQRVQQPRALVFVFELSNHRLHQDLPLPDNPTECLSNVCHNSRSSPAISAWTSDFEPCGRPSYRTSSAYFRFVRVDDVETMINVFRVSCHPGTYFVTVSNCCGVH